MKLTATINPKSAGYQSPSFFTDGENTAGKLNTIHVNPKTHTIVSNFGRFMIIDSMLLRITNFNELRILQRRTGLCFSVWLF
jgi:hypothetical protein